jgi:hypothetical protein
MCDRRIPKKTSTVISNRWLDVSWKFGVRFQYIQQNLVRFLQYLFPSGGTSYINLIKTFHNKYSNQYQTAGFHLNSMLPTAVFCFMYVWFLISLHSDNVGSFFQQ